MWLNCIYGGKGVGMINLLLFLIIGIFLAGQMVGRTPEYLGKKIGGREMTLAMIALLVHPFLILGAVGAVCGDQLGHQGGEQSRGAWSFGNRLPILFIVGQQRFGLRRPGRVIRPEQQSESVARGRAVGYRRRLW